MTSFSKISNKLSWPVIFSLVGYILLAEAALLLLPILVGIIYRETASLQAFFIVAGLAALAGIGLSRIPTHNRPYYARDGFFVVGLGWIAVSLFGALPFTLSGTIPSYIDAVFETVSGFTTTGATILTDIESLSRSMLFWRSFTHWIGGMGILVFLLAFLPKSNENSMHIMRAEVPGPSISKLVPKVRTTAKILYILYFGLTLLEVILLLAGGMPLFDALINSMGTAGTGGFAALQESIGQYHNLYYEMVIALFMFLFGINFNLYFFLLLRQFKPVFRDQELKVYVGIVLFATITITLNIASTYGGFWPAMRYSIFQVVSVITTTGYATTDFNLWPMYSKGILFILMVVGAMAGSTGGGVKIARAMIVFKQIKLNIQKLIHPKKVNVIMMSGKAVDSAVVAQTMAFFSCWMVLIGAGILLVSLDNFDFETTVSSVFTCIGNVGPGFGLCGPMGGFAAFSPLSKIVLALLMLIGRLEIYPILIFTYPLIQLINQMGRHKKNILSYRQKQPL